MNINFIKWMVGYADGFELKFTGTINHELVEYRHRSQMITCDWHKIETWILYPLLLQRAIEGINKKNISPINQAENHITVELTYDILWDNVKYFHLKDNTFDQIKEEALKYIWEQEK